MKTPVVPNINRASSFEVLALADLLLGGTYDAGSPCFQVLWVTNGSIDYKLNMHPGTITAGQVLRVRPGEVFLFDCVGNTGGFLVRIANGFLEGLEHRLLLSAGPTGITINNEIRVEMEDITRKMKNEISNGDVLKDDILRRYTEIFLIHLARSVKSQFRLTSKSRNVELTENFMELLDRHYREKKMVSDYANMMSLTPNYLNEIVKKITGESASFHIRQRIAVEAKRHAAHSNLCMKEIAYALGFGDIAHFSKFFKNTTGQNFSEFRKEQLVYSLVTPRSPA